MMEAFVLLGLIFSMVLLFKAFSLTKRNNKVLAFRNFVLELSSNYEKSQMDNQSFFSEHRHYLKLPSYDKMLYSSKPLTLENYFTVEEIEQLASVEDNKQYLKD